MSTPSYHDGKDGEGGDDLGEEPGGGLDVLLAIQNLVEDGESLRFLFRLGTANVALDLLLELGTGSLLWVQEGGTTHKLIINVAVRVSAT